VLDGVNDFLVANRIDQDGGDTQFTQIDIGDFYVTNDAVKLYVGFAHDKGTWTTVQLGLAIDVDTADGSIAVTASGQITATDVASLTDNDANDITLTGVGIKVGSIVAGAGVNADVMLNAGTGAISDLQNDTVGHDADGFATQTDDARIVNIVAN